MLLKAKSISQLTGSGQAYHNEEASDGTISLVLRLALASHKTTMSHHFIYDEDDGYAMDLDHPYLDLFQEGTVFNQRTDRWSRRNGGEDESHEMESTPNEQVAESTSEPAEQGGTHFITFKHS